MTELAERRALLTRAAALPLLEYASEVRDCCERLQDADQMFKFAANMSDIKDPVRWAVVTDCLMNHQHANNQGIRNLVNLSVELYRDMARTGGIYTRSREILGRVGGLIGIGQELKDRAINTLLPYESACGNGVPGFDASLTLDAVYFSTSLQTEYIQKIRAVKSGPSSGLQTNAILPSEIRC